jgi:Alpha/beta hydrolase family
MFFTGLAILEILEITAIGQAPIRCCLVNVTRTSDYIQVVVDEIGDKRDIVVVAQSLGAFTAVPLCNPVSVTLLVLLNAMVPAPGETAGAWWENTGQPKAFREHALAEGRDPDAEFDPVELFLHDVPRSLWEESAKHAGPQAARVFADAVPFETWPDIQTHAIVSRRDRFFPAGFQRRLIRERLGIEPHEIGGGHLAALGHATDLTELLERLRTKGATGRIP